MERIKQAMEQARKERERHLAQGDHTAGGGQGTPAFPQPADITYSETRTLQVSTEVLRRNRIVAALGESDAVHAYNMLRTQVLQRMVGRDWNALALTSPGPGQGKTLTTVNLAVSLARDLNYTVLLVDLDLRRPSVHRYFDFRPERGLDDYLLRDTPLSKILVNPGVDRLVVLPAREPLVNSSELISSPKMVRLVDELKSRYPSRFVLFDLPPLLSTDDALAFSPFVDATLLVVEEGKTTDEELRHAMEYLRATQLLGTVLNKSEDALARYY